MNILVVAPRMPDVYGGGSLRMYSQIRYLADQGVAVDLLCPADERETPPEALKNSVRAIYTVQPHPAGIWERVRNALAFNVYTEEKNFADALSNILSANEYDLVHVHKFQMAVYLKRLMDTPVVVDLWACGLRGAWLDFVHEGNILRKLVKLSRLPRYYLADRSLYAAFENYFVVSEEARKYVLSKYPRKKVYVVPHGVEIPGLKSVSGGKTDEKALVFVGDMSFSQNVDTVLFFSRNVFPTLKKRLPGLKFYIVGKAPAPEVLALGKDSSIIVTGFVEDVGAYLARAAVFVAPIRTGSGLRTKLLEAFAYGLPVITTLNACEGIPVRDGVNVVLAEKSEEYVEKTIWLIENEWKAREIGANARAMVLEKYSWGKIAEAMNAHYAEILDHHNIKG